jgi:hypothetical protein
LRATPHTLDHTPARIYPLLRASRKRITTRQPSQQLLEFPSLTRFNHIVSIEPERIITRGAGERGIARRREVIHPDEVENLRTERPRNFHRAVGAPSVDDNNLIKQSIHRFERVRKITFLVTHDHRQADARTSGASTT